MLASYHGIPQAYFDQGDPYYCHCAKTTRLLGEALKLDGERLKMTFQSRFGRAEWLKPYTAETVRELASRGVKRVVVVTPGFAADCLETLEEIGVENASYFREAGGETLRRDSMPQRQRRRRRGHRSGGAAGAWGVDRVIQAVFTRSLSSAPPSKPEPWPRSLVGFVPGAAGW